jgi:alpha-D-ribose 1-methylphosphonate 5-triphosphate synthase subunit PhnH
MFSAAETIDGGFADPVFDAQSVFRAVMDAMARPGTVLPVKALAAPPAPLSATAAALALTLSDHDTPLWLDPALSGSAPVRAYLAFHTGAPVAEARSEAAFALVAHPLGLGSLAEFGQGTQEYPDRSTTLIMQVDALSSDVGQRRGETNSLVLAGPGIRGTASLAAFPLPENLLAEWQANRARFPRGVDVILAAPTAVTCLPRSVKIREG